MRIFVVCLVIGMMYIPFQLRAQSTVVESRLLGRILLDVEHHGEAWYLYPVTRQRYFLGRPGDAFDIMRFLSVGITDANLAKIPKVGDTFEGDRALRQRLSGRIVLQVQSHGEAWYIYPEDQKRYYLGRPEDAFGIMGALGLGITAGDLAKIPLNQENVLLGGAKSKYQSYTLTISRGAFDINVVTLAKDQFSMATATAELLDCKRDCAAKRLEEYVQGTGGTIGIHGTYFCPPDYSQCADAVNSFLPPVYNTEAGRMINDDILRFHGGPIVAQGTSGRYYFYHRARDFGSVSKFEAATGDRLFGAIANSPSLLEAGQVVVHEESLDDAMQVKATRGGIGYNGKLAYLVIARGATVPDLAYILKALGASYAMNLDGGGSAALYYNGVYKFGPGRLLPNAIVFKAR